MAPGTRSATEETVVRRSWILTRHLQPPSPASSSIAESLPTVALSPCLQYSPPEDSEKALFNSGHLSQLLDAHNFEERDWLYRLMEASPLFRSAKTVPPGGRPFIFPDYSQSMEQQREMTMRRILYLESQGVFADWLTRQGPEAEMRHFAIYEICGVYDLSVFVKLGVHFSLWGCSLLFLGTKRHHKWLRDTEKFIVKGCFSMTELGHGSNVRGIETIATYDSNTEEFIINTPCESAQKYWIGGAAKHANHTIIFAQLHINGRNEGVHAFAAQIRDADGNICPNMRIVDCGHKIGLNGVDNGRIWFDNLRVPRENLLNSVADVTPDGQYISSIKNPDERFAAFLAPLTIGRVNILCNALSLSKIGLSVAIRYSLTRRAFSISPGEPEALLLDYPSHQRRLLPLVAKTCAMTFAANNLKKLYVNRTPKLVKAIHIYSSALKAVGTWQNMKTLQECREACGGQGLKTENQVGILKGECDVQSTFEGDNNVLMQQVSKALLSEYMSVKKMNRPYKGLGLEHMNGLCPVIASNLTALAVRSSQFQMDIFWLRERDLLGRLAQDIAEHQSRGERKERALILSYKLAEELARAFAERVVLESILEVERGQPAGSIKDVLGLLRSVYALISIEEDSSFLRYGYLSTQNAAIVRRELTKLIGEMRPHALSLVKSFGIPDSFLSPLAFDWIEANSWAAAQA